MYTIITPASQQQFTDLLQELQSNFNDQVSAEYPEEGDDYDFGQICVMQSDADKVEAILAKYLMVDFFHEN